MPVQLVHVVVALCGLLFVGWYAGPTIGKILPGIGFRDGTPAPLLLTGTEYGARSESAINASPPQGNDSVAQSNTGFKESAVPNKSFALIVRSCAIAVYGSTVRAVAAVDNICRPLTVWFYEASASEILEPVLLLLLFLVSPLAFICARLCHRLVGERRKDQGVPVLVPACDLCRPASPEELSFSLTPSSRESVTSIWHGSDASSPTGTPVNNLDTKLSATTVIQRWVRSRFKLWLTRSNRTRNAERRLSLHDWRQDGTGDVAAPQPARSGSSAVGGISPMDRAALSYVSRKREEPIITANSEGQSGVPMRHRNLDEKGDGTRSPERIFAWSPDDSVQRRETEASSPSSASSSWSRPPAARASFPLGGKLQTEETDPLSSPAPALSRPQHQNEQLVMARLPDSRALAWQQRRPGRASTLVFGELLQESQQRLPVSFGAMLEEIGADGCSKLCESSSSEVFRVGGSRGVAVLKVLHFAYLVRHVDLVLAEVRIARALQGLTKNPENSTVGFAEVRAIYCVWDKYPPMMANACMNYCSRKKFSLFGDADRERFQPYVVMYMSFAGRPLHKVQFQSALQLRSVVQQVTLTLAVAEAGLQFEHRALTPGHVLVKQTHDQVLPFWLDGHVLFVDMFGVQATVVDFSTARLLPPGGPDTEPVFADMAKIPRRKMNALGDTFPSVCRVVSREPSAFYPWTNLAYLEELTGTLVREYQGHFPADPGDEAEQLAWDDVLFWLEEMPHYARTRDFAVDLVAESARRTASGFDVTMT